MPSPRQVIEGRQYQGVDEEIAYQIDTEPWSPSPTNVVCEVRDVTDAAYTNVTTTVMPSGTPTVNENLITLPKLKALTNKHLYRVEVKFNGSGNIFEFFFFVQAEL